MDFLSAIQSISLVTIFYALFLVIVIVVVTVSTVNEELLFVGDFGLTWQHRGYSTKIKISMICANLQILIGVRLTTWNAVPMLSRFESEKVYKDPNNNYATYPFPFIEEEGSIDLSVIVPSYNEEERREY